MTDYDSAARQAWTLKPAEIAGMIQALGREARCLMPVDRILVVSQSEPETSKYRVTSDHAWSPAGDEFVANPGERLFSGGLLSDLLRAGRCRLMSSLSVDANDPAADVLLCAKSMMAFPLLDAQGATVGMLLLLSSSPAIWKASEICAHSIMTHLLGKVSHRDASTRRPESFFHNPRPASVEFGWHPAVCTHEACEVLEFLADGALGVLIADASEASQSGEVPLAAMCAIARSDMSAWTSPARLLLNLNSQLCELLNTIRFDGIVTAFCGLLDSRSGTLIYASAGHDSTRLCGRSTAGRLSSDGSWPLGMVLRPAYQEKCIKLLPGDSLRLRSEDDATRP